TQPGKQILTSGHKCDLEHIQDGTQFHSGITYEHTITRSVRAPGAGQSCKTNSGRVGTGYPAGDGVKTCRGSDGAARHPFRWRTEGRRPGTGADAGDGVDCQPPARTKNQHSPYSVPVSAGNLLCCLNGRGV